jgi:HK97 family phage major capsid protein
MKSSELRVKRAQAVETARSILSHAESERRAPTGEEQRNFNVLMDEADKLGADVDRIERLEREERTLAQSQGRYTEPQRPSSRPGGRRFTRQPDGVDGDGGAFELKGRRGTPEYRSAFESYLRGGIESLGAIERRDLSAENDVQGGYMVAPQQTANSIIKALDNLLFIRRLATTIPVVGSESLGCPSLDADPADADWTSELATGTNDSSMAFGKRELHPRPVAKRIKISRKLLSRMPGVEGFVNQRLAYKFAVTQEKAFLTGDGANKPLGLFTASSQGISTGRDVLTGSSTSITFDALYDAKYSLKQQYQNSPTTAWLFHRDAVKIIAKLKDGQSRYIWEPSVQVGQPDRLLNLPVMMSEYAPNTFTTGKYVGLLGDFSFYWIADADTLSIQRLVELYAETNQVGLIGRLESDGMPVLEEAFARLITN